MRKQERKTRQSKQKTVETEEIKPWDKEQDLKSELDDLLDEIDDVLETNAEDFIKSYIQKGGE